MKKWSLKENKLDLKLILIIADQLLLKNSLAFYNFFLSHIIEIYLKMTNLNTNFEFSYNQNSF